MAWVFEDGSIAIVNTKTPRPGVFSFVEEGFYHDRKIHLA